MRAGAGTFEFVCRLYFCLLMQQILKRMIPTAAHEFFHLWNGQTDTAGRDVALRLLARERDAASVGLRGYHQLLYKRLSAPLGSD
jgi:hypothetical protein